jgi:adenylyl-sulfate kinase
MNSGCTVWFTGMSGSGKSTVSNALAQRLREAGARVEVLDGDVVRTRLCKDLGFSHADREENIRRIGFVCELLSRNGVIAIVAAISPYRASRGEVRSRLENFIEVYMRCPMEVLIQRDVKGLYKRALAGEIALFTGISDPYEAPLEPEVTIDSSIETPGEGLAKILDLLEDRGILQTKAASLADSSTALRTGEWVLGQSQLPPR